MVKKKVESKSMGKNTTLIITEKPAAAAKIAAALSGATDEKITNKDKVSYYEFYKGSRRYIVGCAVGHLFGIQQIAKRGPFPNFEVEWQPAHQKGRASFTKKYLTVLKRLAKEADEFIVATDFDVEGEVIGWNVVRFICKQKDAKRMKFSLLTKEALDESFENLLPTLNWGAAIAGETRHYIDWFYGINLSRGLM
ncbi:MAG: toprim domain-containing protein, partial [Nanoarchaeota archaeon]|nr:toprim domain-containing protein [Nanoarchaeota archaeon]